jgi:hypothetical protein
MKKEMVNRGREIRKEERGGEERERERKREEGRIYRVRAPSRVVRSELCWLGEEVRWAESTRRLNACRCALMHLCALSQRSDSIDAVHRRRPFSKERRGEERRRSRGGGTRRREEKKFEKMVVKEIQRKMRSEEVKEVRKRGEKW